MLQARWVNLCIYK